MKITGEELFKIWVAWPVREGILDCTKHAALFAR